MLLCSDSMVFSERTEDFTGDAEPVVTLMTSLASDGSRSAFLQSFFLLPESLSGIVTPAAVRI